MSIESIQAELTSETGIRFCEICGLPYRPGRCTQRLCGSKDCLKKYRAAYTRKWNEENQERYKELKRRSAKRCRQRIKSALLVDEELRERQEIISKSVSLEERIKESGTNYGEYQKKKLLASIPKINTEL